MSVLYFREAKSHKNILDFSVVLIKSMGNAADYTLCLTDYKLWNVQFGTCGNYWDRFADDISYLKDNFGLKLNYNYIWE